MPSIIKNISCVLLVVFSLSGCVSSRNEKPQHMLQAPPPKQVPSVIILKPIQLPSAPAPVCDNSKSDKIISIFNKIESAFLEQNCDAVMEQSKILEELTGRVNLTNLPVIVQAAMYTCDAKAGIADPTRLALAITNLKTLSLRYPFINEAWLHNTLADFYIALQDTNNALAEKKQARDLLLTQQQDISLLNDEILKLNPNEKITIDNSNNSNSTSDAASQSIDQITSTVTQLINNDSPEQAIAILDTIPTSKKSEPIKKLRKEAVHNLVTNLRYKVRALFMRSMEQTGPEKKDSLQQCEIILNGIIKNYPDYQEMSGVLYNLKQVQRELNKN